MRNQRVFSLINFIIGNYIATGKRISARECAVVVVESKRN